MEMLGFIVGVNQRLPMIRCLSLYIRWFIITVLLRMYFQSVLWMLQAVVSMLHFFWWQASPQRNHLFLTICPLCMPFVLCSFYIPHPILDNRYSSSFQGDKENRRQKPSSATLVEEEEVVLIYFHTIHILKCIPFIWRCRSSTFPHCSIQRMRGFCCLFSNFSAILSFEDTVFLSQIVFIYQDNWRIWLLIVHNLRSDV